MRSIDRRFDVVVIGSGAGGSIAVKELTERGLDVLLLEASRDLTDADFTPPLPKAPRPLGMDLDLRAKAMLAGQLRQARPSASRSAPSRNSPVTPRQTLCLRLTRSIPPPAAS